MAKQRVLIVGGGLAGLAAAMKLAELGHRRRSDEPDAGQALAQRLCPGRHQQRQRPDAAARRRRVAALRRHGLWRRLSAASAAGQGDVRLGAEDHRPDGPAGRDVQPHAGRLSRSAAVRRHALQADGVRRRDDRPAAALRARRAGPPLGEPRARSRKFEFWDFLGPVLDDNGVCRGAIGAGPGVDGDSRASRPTR